MNDISVAHVVQKVGGYSIPVEIAGAISERAEVDVGLISIRDLPAPQDRPDIINSETVLEACSPVRSYRRLVAELEEKEYDIVHTHHNRSAVRVAWSCRGRSLVHFNTQHGHLHYSAPQKALNLVTLLLTKRFSYNSKTTKESYSWFENILRAGGFHRVIHNGVDLDRLEPFQKVEYGPLRTLVTASRLIRRKNISVVLEALKSLPRLGFIIVGEGPLRKDLQTKARQMGVTEQVEFVGFVQDREDVYRILSQGDAFVHPSFSEGFCVAVAEAMALGLPVIVSDIPVFHEVVGDEGLFVNPTDPQSLERTLKWLINHPQEGEKRGLQNRHRIQAHFDLDDIASEYVETYRSILQSKEE
jgi:glycosyltransferase involved in cell wall biosynthesis